MYSVTRGRAAMEVKLQPFLAHYDSLQANIQTEDGFLREFMVGGAAACLRWRRGLGSVDETGCAWLYGY